MSASSGPAPGGGVPAARWAASVGWRVFPGEDRQLRTLRQWLVTMLPDCPERHDVLAVATELASNAVKHTASGRGGTFAVALLSGARVMRVAVADGGAEAGPRMTGDPAGENGRGLLIVRGLSARTGASGDEHGRLVWAEIPWPVPATVTALLPADQGQDLLAEDGLVTAALSPDGLFPGELAGSSPAACHQQSSTAPPEPAPRRQSVPA